MVKNIVVEGDYKGKLINSSFGVVMINLGLFSKGILINKKTVKNYEILNEEKRKSIFSGVTRGFIGGILFGGVGLLAGGLSAKNKGEYLIAIEFMDGKRSLLNVDSKVYKNIIANCF